MNIFKTLKLKWAKSRKRHSEIAFKEWKELRELRDRIAWNKPTYPPHLMQFQHIRLSDEEITLRMKILHSRFKGELS
jgi:hypothetical protein